MTVGQHQAFLKAIFTALRSTAVRQRRNVYGGTFVRPPDPKVTRGWIEPGLRNRGVRRDFAKFLRAVDPKDLLDVSTRFGTFAKPVRLVWGDADPFFPFAFGEKLAAAFPNATITPVPGASTFVPMEFPEQVATAVAK